MKKICLSTEKRLSSERTANDTIKMIPYAEYEKELLSFLENNFSGIYFETHRDGGEGYVAIAFERASQVILDLFCELLGRCAVLLENTVSESEAVTTFSFPAAFFPSDQIRAKFAFFADMAGMKCEYLEKGDTLSVRLHIPLYAGRTFSVYAFDGREFLRALEKVFFEE